MSNPGIPIVGQVGAWGMSKLNRVAQWFAEREPVSDEAPNIGKAGPGCSETSVSGPQRDPIHVHLVGVDDECASFVANDTLAKDLQLADGDPTASSIIEYLAEPIEELHLYDTLTVSIATDNYGSFEVEEEGEVLAVRIHETVLVTDRSYPDYDEKLRLLEHPEHGLVAERRRYTNEEIPREMYYVDIEGERFYFAYDDDGIPRSVTEYGIVLDEDLSSLFEGENPPEEFEAWGLVRVLGDITDSATADDLEIEYYNGYPVYLSTNEEGDLNEVYFIQQPLADTETPHAEIYKEFLVDPDDYIDQMPFIAGTLQIYRADGTEAGPIVLNPEIFIQLASTGEASGYVDHAVLDEIGSIGKVILTLSVDPSGTDRDPDASYEACLNVSLYLEQGGDGVEVQEEPLEPGGGCVCEAGY